MKPIGKSKPDLDNVSKISKLFDKIELYLEIEDLDKFDETITNCRDSDFEIATVHTPHVKASDIKYIDLTNKLAEELNAKIVLHSQNILTHKWDEIISRININQPYGIENQPGDSYRYIINNVIEPHQSITLDVAHLYMSTGSNRFFEIYESILSDYRTNIELIHFSDATIYEDGLPFGDGHIEMEKTIEIANKYYDGMATVEVMPNHQKEALLYFEQE